LKKRFAYRFMVTGIGTLQEGFFDAHHIHHAKRKAQKICRDEVLSAEVTGKWTRWGQRGAVYGSSFLDERTGRYSYRLMFTEVSEALPAGDDHPPTPLHRLLPAG